MRLRLLLQPSWQIASLVPGLVVPGENDNDQIRIEYCPERVQVGGEANE